MGRCTIYVGKQGQRLSLRKQVCAGLLAMSLGLSATVLASPTAKGRIAAAASDSKGVTAKRHWFQVGKASWYGGSFNGRKTADGEIYDMYGLTCAHRTLPLGSWIRVTNLLNKKWAFVRVNDRGPMTSSHIVDLSYGAARRLGVVGLAKVRIEPLNPADKAQTEQLVAQLSMIDDPVVVAPIAGQPALSLLSESH